MKITDKIDSYQKHLDTAVGSIQEKLNYIEEQVRYITDKYENETNSIEISISDVNNIIETISKYGAIHIIGEEYNKYKIILGDYIE